MDLQKIKSQLPSGGIKTISVNSGVHYATVQAFFNGKKTKEDLSIMKFTAQYLKEYKEAKASATNELQAVASA